MSNFHVPIIIGDLTSCDADIIMQQSNCITVTPLGLAEQIKTFFGVDPYKKRKSMKGHKNCAIKEDRDMIGKVKIYCTKINKPKYIACIFAQFTPGKPSHYYDKITSEHINPFTGKILIDDYSNRKIWFQLCLDALTETIIKIRCKKVAFPFQIGCGLAGGNWCDYEKMITQWAQSNKDKFDTIIVKRN